MCAGMKIKQKWYTNRNIQHVITQKKEKEKPNLTTSRTFHSVVQRFWVSTARLLRPEPRTSAEDGLGLDWS
jgi:hypothetical protein